MRTYKVYFRDGAEESFVCDWIGITSGNLVFYLDRIEKPAIHMAINSSRWDSVIDVTDLPNKEEIQ